MKIDIDTGVHT